MPISPACVLERPALDHGLVSRYEVLIRLAEAIRSHADEKELFRALAGELKRVVEFDGLCRFDGAANKIQCYFVEPYNSKLETCGLEALPKEQTVAWWVYRNQQPVVIRVTDQDTRFPHLTDMLTKLGLKTGYVLPLSSAHRLLGSLSFVSHVEDAYSPEEQRFLSLVANQIAVALDDAEARKRLRLLLNLTNRVVSKLELRELLREVATNICQAMQWDGVAVALPDPENGELRPYSTDFQDQEVMVEPERVSEAAREVFRIGTPIILTKEQIAADPILAVRFGARGINSLCALPLVGRVRPIGVLGVGSLRDGAFTEDDVSFLSQVARQIAIAIENASAYAEISQLKDRLARQNVYLESEIRSELGFEDIVGNSPPLKSVLKEIETVAPTDSTVLICGETGTGKELIARAVHNLSSRKSNAFVKLNCAAIPMGLLESELFGHEKGAFTGAIAQRVGRFELAHRGTIFLDEIGEIPLELQPKLLHVLQEREFERLGSTRTIRTDARLIAATNRDLKVMVEEQKFRSDLYYRLNVFPVRVPALRERKDDIPLLVLHFLQQFSRANNRVIDTILSETMEALVRYHWPGNIRELQNVIERAVIISKGPVLNVALGELQRDRIRSASQAAPIGAPADLQDLQSVLEETERTHILRALEASNGFISGPNGAAARLAIKRSTLQLRMQKLGIRRARAAFTDRVGGAE
jgi:formate hydrogenlyase transcriptional activator